MEKIALDKCPICGESHIFNLKVERVTILRNLTMDDLNRTPTKKTFIRIFNCPKENKKFQGTITLYGDDIKNVEIIEDKNEG